jgi:hypothetical protein
VLDQQSDTFRADHGCGLYQPFVVRHPDVLAAFLGVLKRCPIEVNSDKAPDLEALSAPTFFATNCLKEAGLDEITCLGENANEMEKGNLMDVPACRHHHSQGVPTGLRSRLHGTMRSAIASRVRVP